MNVLTLTLRLPLLNLYGLNTLETHLVNTPQAARELAKKIGLPVALKLSAPALTHKSSIGGVRLNIMNEDAVEQHATDLLSCQQQYGDVAINGLNVPKNGTHSRYSRASFCYA